MDPSLEGDLGLVKSFFEELIGCVAGCGCWQRGWDDQARIRAFAREGFRDTRRPEEASPRDVLDALDRLPGHVTPTNLEAAREQLELYFRTPEELSRFFENARESLRRALDPGRAGMPPPTS